jgi:precorrin-3B methylase
MDSQQILISHCDNYDWIDSVDMMSVVYFCDEKTIKINEKLVVPRGYVK